MTKKMILLITTIIITIVNLFQIIKLDILPLKYMIVIIISLSIFIMLGYVLLTRKKTWLKVIGVILLIILIIGNIFSIYHMKNINDFFNKSFQTSKTEKIKYYVVALEKNHYKNSDINGDLGYYEESINVKEAIKYLDKKYKIEDYNFDDMNNMFDKLDAEELKMVLIEKTKFNIITELDENRHTENYQILEEFTINKKLQTKSSQKEDIFNIYVGGTDYVGLMDLNAVITVNTKTHKILLTSMPRDSYVEVHGLDYKNKLSFIIEGIDVNQNTIADFIDIDIDYYIKIDADSVVKLVDELGGIEYCSDYDYTGSAIINKNGYQTSKSYHFVKGCQHLNGYQTVAASRTRNAFNGRDHIRQRNMQKIMIAIVQKIVSPENITNYEGILDALADSYETNIPKTIITKNVKDILNNGNKWTIETQSIEGEDGKDTVHRFSFITDWVTYPDENTVKEANKKIKEITKE